MIRIRFFLFVLFITTLNCYSQKYIDVLRTNFEIVNNQEDFRFYNFLKDEIDSLASPTYTKSPLIPIKTIVKEVEQQVIVEWYMLDAICIQRGTFDTLGMPNGMFYRYSYRDTSHINFLNGMKHGIEFDKENHLLFVTSYFKGKMEGYSMLYEYGNISRIYNYSNNVIDGWCHEYFYANEESNNPHIILVISRYFKNGKHKKNKTLIIDHDIVDSPERYK